ncbi:hypothetical protein BDF19DRAFT_417065 [Syncephalis fuscata]|nr:hypothetical protein BDF19DRAFT_417065 [Syncephalis fuscata]
MSFDGQMTTGSSGDCPTIDSRWIEVFQQYLNVSGIPHIDPYLLVQHVLAQLQINATTNPEKLAESLLLQDYNSSSENYYGELNLTNRNISTILEQQCLPNKQAQQMQLQYQHYQQQQQQQLQQQQQQVQLQQQGQQTQQLQLHQQQQRQQQQLQLQQSQSRSMRRRVTHVPSKPPNAFIIFRRERAIAMRNEDPKIKNGEISKLTGKEWREASPVLKDAYRRKAETLNVIPWPWLILIY